MKRNGSKKISFWYGRIENADPFPDLDYWRVQSDIKIFDVAWEMVVEAHAMKGEKISESQFQRSVGGLFPLKG